MSKSAMEVRELTDELSGDELNTVTGGVSDLGKYITKAVDDAISGASSGGPPEVWVGCAWVPQLW